jgi:IS605 OrfB family transposase
VRTYQTRLNLSAEDSETLERYADRFSRAQLTLFARRSAATVVRKPDFMREFGLTARQYNAVRVNLDGTIASQRERQPQLLAEAQVRIKSLEKTIARKKLNPEQIHHKKRRLVCLREKRSVLERDIETGTVRIAFGSRKLFHAQYSLVENGFADHAAWKAAWRQARSSQFFVLGSKDETAGCQGCVLSSVVDDCFSLRLRLPNSEARKYVEMEARFAYGAEHLRGALTAGQAISYRFLRDERGWRVFASTKALDVEIITDKRLGSIGVDLNADHIAVAETDRFGNLIYSARIPLITYGKSQEQAKAIIGECVKEIVGLAVRSAKPIAIERLDFSKKKARLAEFGVRYSRMLSSFAYSQFAQLLTARAHDAGISVRMVNPAYSSLIGRVKFARRYGISKDMAAALVIGRRIQGFSERPGRRVQVALGVPVRKHARHVWSFWSALAWKLAGDVPPKRSRLGRDSHAAAAAIAAAARATIPFRAGGNPAGESAARTVRAASLAPI